MDSASGFDSVPSGDRRLQQAADAPAGENGHRFGDGEVEEWARPEIGMKNFSKAGRAGGWVYNVWNWEGKAEIPVGWNRAALA